MELHRALNQISEIHEQLAKGEVYRGFRSVPVGLSGLLALAAPMVQIEMGIHANSPAFVYFWAGLGALGVVVSGFGIAYNYTRRNTERERRLTRRVVGQLAPSIFAGVLLTAAMLSTAGSVVYMPGLWAILFSLGIFAARPYLPRMVGWVALYYLLSGFYLLLFGSGHPEFLGWGMGICFGFGQLASAVVLYWNLEGRSMVSEKKNEERAGRFSYDGLDRVMHEKARLGILTSLCSHPEGLVFNELKELCSLTDGNLSRHLGALEEARLVEVKKSFNNRRPQTVCRMTAAGRKRFVGYLEELERVIADAESARAAVASTNKAGLRKGYSPA